MNKGFTSTPQRASGVSGINTNARLMWGFTLIEILVSMSISIVILAIGFPITLDFYRSNQLSSERNGMLAILREARSQAMNHAGNSNHGVYIASSSYTIFQGTSYAARSQSLDQNFPRSSAITISGPTELVFIALSGKTSSTSFSFSNADKTFYIKINSEGRIDWTP